MNAFTRPPAGRSDKGFTHDRAPGRDPHHRDPVGDRDPGVHQAARARRCDASLKSDLRTVAHELTETYADLNAYFVVTGGRRERHRRLARRRPSCATSPGNRIDGVLIGTTGYCLTGHNDRASADFYYSSAAGQTDAPC